MNSIRTISLIKSLSRISLIVLAVTCSANSQTGATIVFSDNGAIPLPDVGHVRLGYPVCRPDGASYFTTMVDPSHSTDIQLVSVATDGTVVVYDVSKIPGLSSAAVQSVAADDSGATLLVEAIPNKQVPAGLVQQGMNQFLVRYDLAGNRLGVHGLPMEFNFRRITPYGRASLLGLRMERNTGALSVAVMDRDGAFIKTIDLGRDLLTTSEVKTFMQQRGVPGMENAPVAAQAESAAALIQMVAVGSNVFLIKSGDAHEVIRIDENGAVRNIQLKVPQGVDPRSIFSDQNLGLTTVAYGPGERDSSLLQFDASTGEETGQIHVSGMSPVSAICRHGDKYYGVRINKAGATLMQGELTKATP